MKTDLKQEQDIFQKLLEKKNTYQNLTVFFEELKNSEDLAFETENTIISKQGDNSIQRFQEM